MMETPAEETPAESPAGVTLVLADRLTRLIAAILDGILAAAIAIGIVLLLIWPHYYPSAFTEVPAFIEVMQDYKAQIDAAESEESKAALEEEWKQKAADLFPSAQGPIFSAYLTFLGTFWLYFATSHFFGKGTTLGKAVFRLKVAMVDDGETPSGLRICVREAIKSFAFFGPSLLIWILVFLPVFFLRYRQSLPDIATGTVVIRK